jgi:cytochrome c oxidase subunit 2
MCRVPSPAGSARRRGGVFALVLLAALASALIVAAGAGADVITPETGPTKNAEDTRDLYLIVLIAGFAVIALVWGTLFYSMFRYRARRGRTAPEIRGNRPLELGWTVGAVGLVTAIGIVMLFFLNDIRNPIASGPAGLAEASKENAALNQPPPPGGKRLQIEVSGQQFLWRYRYPNGAVSFHDLVVPKDTTVTLEISSNDVAHSWWIPKLGGKVDALRGLDNETWFNVRETGVFKGQCAEFCGRNHAFMTAKVIVVEPDQYQQWVANQKRDIAAAQRAVQKQRKVQQKAAGG